MAYRRILCYISGKMTYHTAYGQAYRFKNGVCIYSNSEKWRVGVYLPIYSQKVASSIACNARVCKNNNKLQKMASWRILCYISGKNGVLRGVWSDVWISKRRVCLNNKKFGGKN